MKPLPALTMPKTRQGPAFLRMWPPLVLILLLGFVRYLHGLTRESLWSDEGWTIFASATPNPVQIINAWVAVDVHPPLFFINLSLWRVFTGDTIFEMRYFSVLLSILGVALAYQVGRTLFNAGAGALAALFYALHDLIRVLTQEVRHYPQQILLATLVLWLYSRFWLKPARGRGLAFALAGAALLYTHYWGGFLLLALALHALLTRWRGLRAYGLAFVGAGLLYLPWLPVLIHQIRLERPGGLPHALENTPYVYAVLAYQLVGIPELFWALLVLIGTTSLFTTGAYGGLWPHLWRRVLPTQRGLLLLLAALLPPLLSVLVNAFYPTLSFRALAVVVPAVLVLAAYGLSQFRAREQYALLAFILLYSLTTRSAGPIERPPWPEMVAYINTHSGPADVVLLENDTDEHAVAYYLDQAMPGAHYAFTESTRELRPATYPDYLAQSLNGRDGLWVVKLGWPPLGDIRPELAAYGYTLTMPEMAYGMYNDRPVLLWRLDRPPDTAPLGVFGEEMHLLRAEAKPHADFVTLNLLWSPGLPPTREYTVSAFLLGAGGAFSNHDSRPMNGLSPTSTWQAGGLYLDSHRIPTEALPPGAYSLGVQVYYFTDEDFTQIENLPAAACDDDPDCRFVIVAEVQIE